MEMTFAYIALQALNLAGTVWIYLERRNDKTNERIDALGARLDEADRTLIGLKAGSSGNLRQSDLREVFDRLNGMDAKLNRLCGEFSQHIGTLNILMNKITERGLK
jgi:hypothetical protein